MTRAEYTMIATLVDRARRAQIDADGGFGTVEASAKSHDRWLANGTYQPTAAPEAKPISATPRTAAHQRVDVDRARELRRRGWSYPRIARELDCSHHAIVWACDEEFRQRRLVQMADYRAKRKAAA